MSIRVKILGGFLLVFFVALILGIVGLVSTNSLTGMSDDLHHMQKSSSEVSTVLNAHYIWRHTLTEAVLTGKEFTGSVDPTTCALGKWLSGEDAQSITDPDLLALVNSVKDPHTYIHTEAKTITALLQSGDTESAKALLVDTLLPKTQDVITLLTSMESRYGALVEEKNEAIIKSGEQTIVIVIILLLVSLAVCVLVGWIIVSSIMKPIRKLTEAAQTIAEGDLNVDVRYDVNDEIGDLAKSFQTMIESTKQQVAVAETMANNDFTVTVQPRGDKDTMSRAMNRMIANLNDMFAQINHSTTQVSAGSKQIADGSQALAQGATEQASAVEQLSASVSAVADQTKQNSKLATKAAHLADTIKTNAEKGSQQMDAMMGAVREINEASQSISKVIEVIDNIAFQTNILALNAAVEAARAGQHGKGFAVVAEEVRSLATKSAEAAQNTGTLIANSMEKAELGARIAHDTAASLTEIVSGINESALIVREIESSAGSQSSAIEQINKGIEQVAHVVQQNSATAEQSAAASEEMSGQSHMLEDLVAQFKLKNQPSVSRSPVSLGVGASGNGKY